MNSGAIFFKFIFEIYDFKGFVLFDDENDLKIYEEMTKNIKTHLRRGLEFLLITIKGHFDHFKKNVNVRCIKIEKKS